MGISAAELASMRAEAAALVLPDTCAIYGMSNTTDAYGDPVLTETLRDTVACALSIESRASQDNAILAQRESSAAFYTLSVGYDTTIEAEDKIVANNKVFRVITLHESQAFMMVKRALVEHTGTAAISLVVEATAQAHASTYNAGEVDEDEVVTLTITITNTGDALLTLANATASGAVTVGAWSDTTLAPHGTATATVTLNTGTAGAQTGYIEFTSDATPSPYRVNFGFEVEATAVMSVSGNAVTITNGDATPSAGDHTQFATKNAADNSDRTFTITATGTVTGINVLVPTGYTLVTPPDASITNSSDTFVVRCNSATPGSAAGSITIESNELVDYVFAVACTVRTYLEKLQTLNWNQLLARSETSGTNADDSSSNNLDGAYNGESLNATTFLDGTPAPSNDGINDFTNTFSAGLASAFSLTAGTLAAWVKMDAAKWEDASAYFAVSLYANAQNIVSIYKSGAKQVAINYIGSNGQRFVSYTIPVTPTDWAHLAATWDTAGLVRLYFNGVNVASSGVAPLAFAATITAAAVGRRADGAGFYLPGNAKYTGYKNVAMSAGDLAIAAVVP